MSRHRWICVAIAIVAVGCAKPATLHSTPTPTTAQPRTAPSTVASVTAPKPSTRPCRLAQLSSRYRSGEEGLGNDFASIVVRNRAARPCQVAGRVRFAAYYASGERDRHTAVGHDAGFGPQLNGTRITAELLGRSTPTRTVGVTLPKLDAILAGEERDDPAQPDGLCRPRDELTPRWLDLEIGPLSLRTRNHGSPGPNHMPSVFGCHGQISLAAILKHP